MKYGLVFLMVIAGLVLSTPLAYSDFTTNSKYVLQASGYLLGDKTIFDSTISLQLAAGAKSASTMQATLDNGLVTIGDSHYLNTGTWQTSILREGKYMTIQGDAQDQNGNVIHVNLFARVVANNQDSSVYSISGKVTGSEGFKAIYSAKVIPAGTSATTPVSTPTTPTATPSTTQPTPSTVNISIIYGASDINNQVHYTPSSIQVAPGTTIVWTNNDNVHHRIMSGVAKALTTDQSTSVLTSDGKIDSGDLAPGQSFQYTITSFDMTKLLDQKTAQLYGISQDQLAGDITFFDPTYQFMVGVISPLVTQPTSDNTVKLVISQGSSDPNNVVFLSPTSVRVTSGTTLEIINNDSVSHQLQSGTPIVTTQGGAKGSAPAKQMQFTRNDIFDSGKISPGQHYRITMTKTGTIQVFDPQYTWINGVIVSTSQSSTVQIAPVQISIALGSSNVKGTATQQQFNQINSYYYPNTIQIVPGTPIIWVNNDSVEHTILSGVSTQKNENPFTPDGKIASTKIAPGQTFTVTINDTGIIRYYDPQYTWMNGVIVSMPPTSSYTIGAKSHNPGLH